MSADNSIHPKYRADIDGLRAVAILLVVMFHAFPDVLPGGFIGVDVFFVISGFLISTIVITNLGQNTFSFLEFYARRIKRIFPALIVVLVACLAFGWFALLPNEYLQLGKHTLGGASFTCNFMFWGEAGYFDNASETKPLLHLWSLGIEEQFYIISPLTLWYGYRKKLNLLYVSTGVCLASFLFNIAMLYEDSTYTFYSPQTRFWELQIGVILALVLQRKGELPGLVWRKYSFHFGLCLLGTAVLCLSPANFFPGWWALLPTLGAALIIFASPATRVKHAILANRVMVWVGKISYPLYLWHWPLLSYAYVMEEGTPEVSIRIGAVLLAFLLAWLTYIGIERPIRTGATSVITQKLGFLLFLVGVMGAVGYAQNGFPGRHSLDKSIAKYVSELEWMKAYHTNDGCKRGYPELAHSNDCLKAKVYEPTILILGDSHSNNLYPGMVEATANTNDNVLNAAAWACPTLFNTEVTPGGEQSRNSCAERANPILDFAIGNNSIKTVIMSARGPLYVTGKGYGDIKDEVDLHVHLRLVTNPEITDGHKAYKVALRSTLARLAAAHKRVIFVMDTPELGFDPKSCVFIRPLKLTENAIREPCAIPKRDFEERNKEYRLIVSSVLKEFPSVIAFDAAKLLCDDQWCWAMKNGDLLYRDDDHLSVEGSRLVAKELVKLLKP